MSYIIAYSMEYAGWFISSKEGIKLYGPFYNEYELNLSKALHNINEYNSTTIYTGVR